MTFKRRIKSSQAWPSPRAILSSERADTLLEVVFALGILATVLTGSIGITAKAFQAGQTARERTQVTDEAQHQMEMLRAFRDNHTWKEFLTGSVLSGSYRGVLNYTGSPACRVTPSCFHMETGSSGPGITEYLPMGDGIPGSVATSFIEIAYSIPAGEGNPPNIVDFTLSYGFVNIGGGLDNVGHIKTRLTNLELVMGTPVPTPGPLPTPTPAPTPVPPTPPIPVPPVLPMTPCKAVFPNTQYVINFVSNGILTNPTENNSLSEMLEFPAGRPGPVPTQNMPTGGLVLPNGRYEVRMMSYDDHVGGSGNRMSTDTRSSGSGATDDERNSLRYERYKLDIYDSFGKHTTTFTNDIPDNKNIAVSQPNFFTNMGGAITKVVATHIGKRDVDKNGGLLNEGVLPVCVSFVKF